MSFIKADYSENKKTGFDPLPKGEYEMVIDSVQERATKSGAESLQIKLVVRNDLDNTNELQKKYHNRVVFNDNWKRKATNQYDMDNFQYILEACQIPEGQKINDMDDFIKLLTGKPVLVYVNQRENEYDGKKTVDNQVAPWNYKQTKFPQLQHKFKKDKPAEKIEVGNEDLPF